MSARRKKALAEEPEQLSMFAPPCPKCGGVLVENRSEQRDDNGNPLVRWIFTTCESCNYLRTNRRELGKLETGEKRDE